MPLSCTPSILTRIGDSTNFNNWKGVTSGSINSISTNASTGRLQPTPTEQSTLVTAESDIFATVACIQEQLNTIGGSTNVIQAAQASILSLTQQIADQGANIQVAKDRVAYIRHPEDHTSFYESWFPIGRPMHTAGIPYFIGVSVTLVLFTIFVLFSIMEYSISVISNPNDPTFIELILSQFTSLTFISLIVLISVVIYFMTRK